MKFFETRFEEYVLTSSVHNFHPRLKVKIDSFPEELSLLKNIILYGSPGVGKYTQALNIISRYSVSSLKYEKKTGDKSQKDKDTHLLILKHSPLTDTSHISNRTHAALAHGVHPPARSLRRCRCRGVSWSARGRC